MHTRSLFFAFLAATVFIPVVSPGKIQQGGLVLPPSGLENRDTVRNMFLNSYEAYRCVICLFLVRFRADPR